MFFFLYGVLFSTTVLFSLSLITLILYVGQGHCCPNESCKTRLPKLFCTDHCTHLLLNHFQGCLGGCICAYIQFVWSWSDIRSCQLCLKPQRSVRSSLRNSVRRSQESVTQHHIDKPEGPHLHLLSTRIYISL